MGLTPQQRIQSMYSKSDQQSISTMENENKFISQTILIIQQGLRMLISFINNTLIHLRPLQKMKPLLLGSLVVLDHWALIVQSAPGVETSISLAQSTPVSSHNATRLVDN